MPRCRRSKAASLTCSWTRSICACRRLRPASRRRRSRRSKRSSMFTDRCPAMPPPAKHARHPLIAIAALVCLDAGLLACGWAALSGGIPTNDAAAHDNWAPPDFNAPQQASGRLRQAADDEPILARPIFFASRKPFELAAPRATAPPPAVSAPPPDPNLVVDGIVLTGKSRRAHMRRSTEADGRWHEPGQIIDGWTVTDIDASGVVLEQAGRRLPFRMYPTDPRAFKRERLSSGSGTLR